MMCDFKPGDEVVCVDAGLRPCRSRPTARPSGLVEGVVYTIRSVGLSRFDDVTPVIWLCETANARGQGYRADRFRKVQRRDLSAWLKTSVGNTDKLDKRQTKKVRA